MQQLQAMQAQNEAAFYQQSQYGQMPYANSQPMYYQAPPVQPLQPQSYPQYIDPRQQQYQTVSQAYPPQYEGSYDGMSFPAPLPQQFPPQQQPRRQNSGTILPSAKPRKSSQPRPPAPPPIDAHTLLPALAEEYFSAAHSLGLSTAQRMEADVVAQYQKLIATGLGCLEAALAGERLEPRLEAKIRLRYAGVLLEETDNMMEAETALSKGITLCEQVGPPCRFCCKRLTSAQNRYFDLKYSMQVLLAKLMFTKSPKAALKALDSHISDVEAYQHHSWIYVFRFLRATLSLQTGRTSDANAALHNLRSISRIATERGDHALFTFSSLMEALASLHIPGPESIENVERALAAAHMYQLDPECKIMPLQALGHTLDVTASLLHQTTEQTLPKLKAMQIMINEAFAETTTWNRRSDTIPIPVNRAKGDAQVTSQDTSGLIKIGQDGRDVILISFLGKSDIWLLWYVLSSPFINLH